MAKADQQTGFNDLPWELKMIIFDRLDFRSRLKCSRVCKEWNNLAMTGPFLNKHVTLNITVMKQPETARFIGSILLQSPRDYKSMTVAYQKGAALGINSMLAIFEKFSHLTCLKFELRHQAMHVSVVEQILAQCPALKQLHLSVYLVCGKMLHIQAIPHQLEELTLTNVRSSDFWDFLRLFTGVPSLKLQKVRLNTYHIEHLVETMPNLEELHFSKVVFQGPHPLRLIKRLDRLSELSIIDSVFGMEYQKWPKLPAGLRCATLRRCFVRPCLMEQIHERWGHVVDLNVVPLSDHATPMIRVIFDEVLVAEIFFANIDNYYR